jgi:hypothetical protein
MQACSASASTAKRGAIAGGLARAIAAAIGLCLLTAPLACGGDAPAARMCTWQLPAACPTPPPSFRRDVDPILETHCRLCHRPGGLSAAVRLGNYAEVYAQRAHVLTQTYACKMPPADASALPEAQAQILFAWLICQAPDN